MKKSLGSMIQLHISVLLFGLSGLFGKLLSQPAEIIVLGRVCLSSLFLFCLCSARKQSLRVKDRPMTIKLCASGLLLAFHWFCFFRSIQISTVSVGLLTFALFPVIVSVCEPFLFSERLSKRDLFLAFSAFFGVLLLCGSASNSRELLPGLLWGFLSAVSYAALALINRSFSSRLKAAVIAFYQQLTAAAALMPALFLARPVFSPKDIWLIAFLGVVCTGVAHTLFISSLRQIKARTAGVVSLLEPVYGILLAALWLREQPAFPELLGGGVILFSAVLATITKKEAQLNGSGKNDAA